MSLDPNTLKKDDKVKFGGKLVRIVKDILYGCDNGEPITSVWFTDGHGLSSQDPLWEMAELVKPELPKALHAGYLTASNIYRLIWAAEFSAPPVLLTLLKQDVAVLEAAGVKEEEK